MSIPVYAGYGDILNCREEVESDHCWSILLMSWGSIPSLLPASVFSDLVLFGGAGGTNTDNSQILLFLMFCKQ